MAGNNDLRQTDASTGDESCQGESLVTERLMGTVQWFNAVTGMGFITPDTPIDGLESGEGVFVHMSTVRASAVDGMIYDGDRLWFDLWNGHKGYFAQNLAVLSDEDDPFFDAGEDDDPADAEEDGDLMVA